MVMQMFWTATLLAFSSALVTWFAIQGACVSLTSISSITVHGDETVSSDHDFSDRSGDGRGVCYSRYFFALFAIEAHLSSVGLFFVVYATMGFAARVASRSLFERFGNRPWIVVGLILLTTSYLLYLPISTTWHLIGPAAVAGIAHALLFPAIMSAGTAVFPRQCLGVATSLILAMFDVGTFISAPLVGIF